MRPPLPASLPSRPARPIATQEDEQKAINSFDEACGTHNTFGPTTHSVCANSHFLCGADSYGTYETCLKGIDCQMHHDMAISVPSGASKFATFARQMIPHHANAVAMAKALSIHHTSADYPAAGTEDQDMEWADSLLRSIFSVQNFQIQQMQGWLDANSALAGTAEMCYTNEPFTMRQPVITALSSDQVQAGTMQTGVPCTPSSNELLLKINMYASEWGAYEVTGCTGVNPQLQLKAGETYTFVQTDASNWYHPIGFAYIAGGAHTECLDSEGVPGECPELGGETAGTTLQYYVDGIAVTTDESGFGLDGYEPLFFNSQDTWGGQTFKVTLTIPADATYTKIYYFCHIHAHMSAEITITGSTAAAGTTTTLDASMLGGETEASALAIFTAIQARGELLNATSTQPTAHTRTLAPMRVPSFTPATCAPSFPLFSPASPHVPHALSPRRRTSRRSSPPSTRSVALTTRPPTTRSRQARASRELPPF